METNPVAAQAWSADTGANCNIVKAMINAITVKYGHQAGIYSNIYMWNKYMGTQCMDLDTTTIAFWYPHDDKTPNFYDF